MCTVMLCTVMCGSVRAGFTHFLHKVSGTFIHTPPDLPGCSAKGQVYSIQNRIEKLPPFGRLFSSSCGELQPSAAYSGALRAHFFFEIIEDIFWGEFFWDIFFREIFFLIFSPGKFSFGNFVHDFFFDICRRGGERDCSLIDGHDWRKCAEACTVLYCTVMYCTVPQCYFR